VKRIVSLVPSWTETLIEAGANVVGRTRFCIHPHEKISSIEAIGGTKSFNAEKLRDLQPELIIMDREENTLEMHELASSLAPVLVTHVERVSDVSRELRAIANSLDGSPSSELSDYANRFDRVLSETLREPVLHNDSIRFIKGEFQDQMKLVYVIWKDPWMCVSRNTFIGSMLNEAGIQNLWSPAASKYPTLDEIPADAVVFLSSEPYPFAKKTPELPNANVAIVDGESFSWFGLRALRYLESIKAK
jgi:ABC-type Fe3+-hydroxamate transport system substrate-binding protein